MAIEAQLLARLKKAEQRIVDLYKRTKKTVFTGLLPGDSISQLTNDMGYLTSGSNISELINDMGYITSEDIPAVPTPYSKVYLASIFQDSPVDPIVSVGYSSFVGTIVWTYIGGASFRGTLTGAFPAGKTFTFNNVVNGNQQVVFIRENNNSVLLSVRDATGTVAYTGTINNINIRIEVIN